jgi:chitinase
MLTHINYAFASPNTDGSISGTADTNLIGAAHRAGCKVLISLGGANSGSVFTTVTSDTNKRKMFVNNLVIYIQSNHYDGADFDWESPSSAADSTNELALMKQVHDAFFQEDSSLLLTMAIGSSSYTGQWRNYSALSQYVKWYNVMTYDLDQGWSGKSGYNAALYYYAGMGNDYSVDQSITYLSGSRHIPTSKLVLGVPFYGKMFSNCVSFNTTFTPPETTPLYYDIVNSNSWIRSWDNVAKVPYLSNGTSLISYDDSLSIALKCQYAKTKSMGGIMIWELSQDVLGSNQPLLNVIAHEMLTPTTSVEQPCELQPKNYTLNNNYPNPFNPSTIIQFSLPQTGFVSLKVYDVLGREVATLINEWRNAGTGSAVFDASAARISSGVYFYRLVAGTFTQTKRCLLVK